MAANEFNLGDFFAKTFGYYPADNFSIDKTQQTIDQAVNKFSIPTAPDRLEHSSLGQPYYKDDLLGREMFLPVVINGFVVPFAVLSIIESKTITETPMPERGGSVKELISLDDYKINIKGILIEEDDVYPEQQIKTIHEIFLINAGVEIRSVLTDIFLHGSYNHQVVIKEVKWPANPGIQHAKPFEMDCVADMIFTLEID